MPPRHPFLRPWSRYCARTPILPLDLRDDDHGSVDRDSRRNGRSGDHERKRRGAIAALVAHDCRDIDRHGARGCRGDSLRGAGYGDAGVDIEITLALGQDTVTRQDGIAAENGGQSYRAG